MEKMSTTARRQIFEFGHFGEMERFISLYKDLFVPYAAETINEKRRYDKKYNASGLKEFGKATYEEGYYLSGGMLNCKMEPESLKEILATGMFRKEKVRRNCYKYV